jgi:hypothetical protein
MRSLQLQYVACHQRAVGSDPRSCCGFMIIESLGGLGKAAIKLFAEKSLVSSFA